MNESPGTLELLSSRVEELEKRVHVLEHPETPNASTPARDVHPFSATGRATSALETDNVFPTIGRAMLGIAGAYVLRAIAEAGLLPRLPMSAFAVAYAFGWLVWSTRVSSSPARLIYAATSALMLAPMLWENTLTFRFFAPMTSAGVLAAFLTFAVVLELDDRAIRRTWIAQTIAVLTTVALAFRTHDVAPFLTAILVAVFVSEFARVRKFRQPTWPLIVMVADVTLWGLIFIYSGPQNARGSYPNLSAAAVLSLASTLFACNGIAVEIRVFSHEHKITAFEVVQVTIAFVLTVAAVFFFAPRHGEVTLGLLSLSLSACGYMAAFRFLRCRNERRNFRVFVGWSAALLLVGALWALPGSTSAVLLAVAAIAAIYFSRSVEPVTLEFHGVLFLVFGAATAQLPRYIFGTMVGIQRQPPAFGILILSICSALAVFVTVRTAQDAWQATLHFVLGFLATCVFTALLSHGVLALGAGYIPLDSHHLAFLRTLTICVSALVIAFIGSRWGRAPLTQSGYAALAFVAAKLLFEDLRHGHMEFIAGAIAVFAITLITMPWLVGLGAQWRTKSDRQSPIHISS